MSTRIISCALCGEGIFNHNDRSAVSWINQFRILYSSQTRVQITGVGCYNDASVGKWLAPLDPTKRWNDAGPACVEIGVLLQRPVDGRYGFPLHESCWSLLEKAYTPESIPYKALFDVCTSLPVTVGMTGLSWGQGLASRYTPGFYPWEAPYIDQNEGFAPYRAAQIDPYHVPEVHQLPLEPPKSPLETKDYSLAADCFSRLPVEVRMMIATQLPTIDALNFCQASRSFRFISHSQQFWASRFTAGAERSWLFEARAWGAKCDLKWVYHRTEKIYLVGGMQNRERIWRLIRMAQELLSLQLAESFVFSPCPDQTTLSWREATGDLQPQRSTTNIYHGFTKGCRLFHEQQTFIPSRLRQLHIFLIQLDDIEYLAGLKLVPSEGEAIQLGYIGGKEVVLDVIVLRGFNLAVGSRGIQGIQCIMDDNQISEWFGCSLEAPRTRRLADLGQAPVLKAGFDGFKMVSLAISNCASLPTQRQTEKCRSLRDLALWYPQIPSDNLYLNDTYFTAWDTSTTRYQPLCWASFGGSKGIYLRHLTGVSAIFQNSLRSLKFHYDCEEVPAECRTIGMGSSSRNAEVLHFPIDGPGGEFIDAMEVHLRRFVDPHMLWIYKTGTIASLQISTNRGRSFHFIGKMSIPTSDKRAIAVVPGSTITGMYWSQQRYWLIALGAISEKV